jgi:hypothetical protein
MKRMLVMLANTTPPNPVRFVNVQIAAEAIEGLLHILHPDAVQRAHQAQNSPNNAGKVTLFEGVANLICWSANNVWVGEAQGNQGTEIDLGPEEVHELQQDLLNGMPFQGIARHYFVVSGWLEARNDMELD